ncbi:MAG TPA: GNAT family N-acetyltransferase [Gaiellaceae bacterium]
MPPAEIRLMAPRDVGECSCVFRDALAGLWESLGLGAYDFTSRLDGGVSHVLGTDPLGSFVAVDEHDRVIGFAQAALRGELWVLAHLFVSPEAQGLGIGGRLLDATVEFRGAAPAGIIAATPDPSAIRSYARLPGFEVHPMLQATGKVDPGFAPRLDGVREGTEADHEFAAHVDRTLRGGAHGPDLIYHLAQGSTLLVLPDRGYAVAGASGPNMVAALDPEAGSRLFAASLAHCGPGRDVAVKRIGASHQWAFAVAIEARLELRPWGPLITHNSSAARSVYLPDSAFC